MNGNFLSRRAFIKQAAIASTLCSPAIASGVGSGAPAVGKAANPQELTRWTALQLSAAIRSKQVSCVEVMAAYLHQIEAFNPRFNALVSLAEPEELLLQARQKDAELARGIYHGWMHGFPHAVKDLADATGFVTSNGSPIFKNNVAASDSIHIERLKRAGCILVAKTNVPEFGLGSQTYNRVFGATLNAYDEKSTAGGSSGGAAAALALNMVPVADGSDLMGSLRNPAAYNNVIGFRPTPGTVPLSSMLIEKLPCNGPMGRTVSDTAMLLSTMAGYDRRAPTSIMLDPATFAGPLARDFEGTKVGWLGDFDGYLPMEPGVLALCEQALDSFQDIGCIVEPAQIDYSMPQLWQTWLTFRHWLVRGRLGELYTNPEHRAQLKPEAVWEVEGALTLTAQDVYEASQARSKWYQAVLVAFEQYDFLVLPTAQVFPFDAQIHWPKTIAGRAMDTYHRWMEVVIPGTLSGCPVINVPAGFGEHKLPMGLQIIGPRFKDFTVLQIAHAYEQASQWNLRHPPAVL